MSATQERALVPVNAANGGPPAMLPVRIETQSIDLMTLAKALAGSGYFKDTRDASQAVVKILYGQELGIGPVSAMMGIHIIEGKPSPSANLLGAMIKRSRRYDYRVICHTADRAEIAFFEHGEEVGRIVWTIEDAARAELAGRGTWKKYPGQMLFSRCLSEGVRVYAPDLFGGAPVYTPEEMGAEVDGETGEPLRMAAPTVNTQTGEVIEAPSRTASAEQHGSYAGATVGGLQPVDETAIAQIINAMTAEWQRQHEKRPEIAADRKALAAYGVAVLGRNPRPKTNIEARHADFREILSDLQERPKAFQAACILAQEIGIDTHAEDGARMKALMQSIIPGYEGASRSLVPARSWAPWIDYCESRKQEQQSSVPAAETQQDDPFIDE